MNQSVVPIRAAALAVLVLGGACDVARAEESAAPAASAATTPAAAPPADEVSALRREIEALKAEVRALQERLSALAAQTASAQAAPAPPAAAEPPLAAPPAAPPMPLAGSAPPARSQNLLNPAISAVFQTIGNTSLRRHEDANGFDLSEAEVAFQSVVDPYAKVDMFMTFPADGSPEVEEGYVTTLALPGSMQLKGGRFKNAFGKWNTLHDHAFFTIERPNALVNFLGDDSLTTDGVSLSVLVPNPKNLYIDSITEVGTAREGVAFNGERRSLTYLEHVAAFFTPSPAGNLEVGLSAALGKTGESEALARAIAGCTACPALAPRDALDSEVEGVDVTYKWRPPQMNVYHSILWQTEILRSHRRLEELTPALGLARDAVTTYGGYTYAEWQPVKRWRVGARYDVSGFPDSASAREWAGSAVIRFQPSEFQEIRFQYKHTRRNEDAAARFDGERDDDQIFFEWIPVIGAHGAHKF